jgi:hypothetical protein
MAMKARVALACAFLFLGACTDEPKKEPLVPTAPPPSRSIAPARAAGGSTVCLRYARDEALAQADLRDHPTSEKLQERVKKLDDLFKDACQ